MPDYDDDLRPEALAAIVSLLGENRTGDPEADLIAAGRQTMEVRRRNSINGAAVLAELRRRGYSWRQIEDTTGINTRSARRWSDPPT